MWKLELHHLRQARVSMRTIHVTYQETGAQRLPTLPFWRRWRSASRIASHSCYAASVGVVIRHLALDRHRPGMARIALGSEMLFPLDRGVELEARHFERGLRRSNRQTSVQIRRSEFDQRQVSIQSAGAHRASPGARHRSASLEPPLDPPSSRPSAGLDRRGGTSCAGSSCSQSVGARSFLPRPFAIVRLRLKNGLA